MFTQCLLGPKYPFLWGRSCADSPPEGPWLVDHLARACHTLYNNRLSPGKPAGALAEWAGGRDSGLKLRNEHILMILCLADAVGKQRPTFRAGPWPRSRGSPWSCRRPERAPALGLNRASFVQWQRQVAISGRQVPHQRAAIDLVTGELPGWASWAQELLLHRGGTPGPHSWGPSTPGCPVLTQSLRRDEPEAAQDQVTDVIPTVGFGNFEEGRILRNPLGSSSQQVSSSSSPHSNSARQGFFFN